MPEFTTTGFYQQVAEALGEIEQAGLSKAERMISGAQGAKVSVAGCGTEMAPILNFCSNNYLGLANDRRVVAAAAEAANQSGAGMASVRFICGTHTLHKSLEQSIASWLGFEDAILFPACFDANSGVFEPLFDERDAIISDSLNHASIIDGIRLCKAHRYRFSGHDMGTLEQALRDARRIGARHIIIVTDGIFSMDGHIANLEQISRYADLFGALLMVDDSHATGVIGENGRGSAVHCGLGGRVDILTGTLGKALGGAMGGFVASRRDVVQLLRERARPYLFSNALSPPACGTALAAIEIARSPEGDALRRSLFTNASHFRASLQDGGLKLGPGNGAIVPVMVGDGRVASEYANLLFARGILVTAFSFPVVPHGQARIRVQLSATHSGEDVARAAADFVDVGRMLERRGT